MTTKEEFEYTKCAEACKGISTLNLAKSDFILFISVIRQFLSNRLTVKYLQSGGGLTADRWGHRITFCINIHLRQALIFSKRPLNFSKRPPFLRRLQIVYKTLRNIDKSRGLLYKYTVLYIFIHFQF